MKTEKQYARRMSPAKKKAILAMLLGECILFTPAVMADSVLAVTVPSDYANSEAGTVTGSRVTTRVNGGFEGSEQGSRILSAQLQWRERCGAAAIYVQYNES